MTQKAKKDLANIYNYIAPNSPNYAKETISNIYNLINILETSPYIGRYVPEMYQEKFYREIIYKKHYRVIYIISEKISCIYILRVKHTAQNFNI